MASIALDHWGRKISVPIGKNLPEGTDLNDEVEITVKGKVKELRAAREKDEEYKGDHGRPAEVTIEITSVTFEGKTNTFTKISREMDAVPYDD
jgi:hypothetical protein